MDFIYLAITFTSLTQAIVLKLNGVIDFGPNFKLENKLKPVVETTETINNRAKVLRLRHEKVFRQTVMDSTTDVPTTQETTVESQNNTEASTASDTVFDTTTSIPPETTSFSTLNTELFQQEPMQVKDLDRLMSFLEHTQKQSAKIFDTVKDQIHDYRIHKELEYLAHNYKIKFGDFVDTTKNQFIKTQDGADRVVLDALETSKATLDRLVHIMNFKLKQKGIINNASIMFEKEIDKVMEVERVHACTRFGVCQSNDSFIHFTTDVINVLLQNDDTTLKTAVNAAMDSIKQIDFNVYDPQLKHTIKKGIDYVEQLEPDQLRNHLTILKNNLLFINKPLILREDKLELGSVILLNIFKKLDELMPSEEFEKYWGEMRNKLSSWSEGKRDDISEIMQSIVNHYKTAFARLNEEQFKNYIKNFLYALLQYERLK